MSTKMQFSKRKIFKFHHLSSLVQYSLFSLAMINFAVFMVSKDL